MARTDNFKNFATDVADSIRSMTGKTDKIPASQFDTEIKSIETKEDLDEELNTYNTEVTEQGVSINTIINLLDGKSINSSDTLNIFVQEETPEITEGIWIKQNNINPTSIQMLNTGLSSIWSRHKELSDSIGLREVAAALVGNTIYIFGGMNRSSVASNVVTAYNIDTDTLTTLSTYPITCYGTLTVVNGTDVYCFGGRDTNSKYFANAYKYDTLTDTYTNLTNLPVATGQIGGTLIDDYVYLFGGTTASGRTNKAYKYSIIDDTYTEIEGLPTIRNTVAVTSIGTNAYLFGGLGPSESLADAYKYDTLTNTYTKLADVPHIGFGMGCVAYNNSIYVLGGDASGDNNIYNTVYNYNPITNKYAEVGSMFYKISRIQSASVIKNNIIYTVGGASGSTTNYAYDPISPAVNNYIQKGVIQDDTINYTSEEDALLMLTGNNGVNVMLNNMLECNLINVYYYSKDSGLNKNIPVYYGDGEKWVSLRGEE